jgi:hypothetical protein
VNRSFAAPDSGKRGRRALAWLASVAGSVLMVWLLMRGLSWERLLDSLLSAALPGLAIYGVLAFAGLWLRARRFGMLLPEPRPNPGPVLLATVIQNALGDLVPARLASLGSYVWLMKRRLSVTGESAASTFIVSFAFDLVSLGPLLLMAVAVRIFATAPDGTVPFSLPWIAIFAGVFFVASAMVAWFLGPLTRSVARVPRALARGRSSGILIRMASFLDRLGRSQEPIRRPATLLRLLAISLAIRLAKYGALFALTESLLAHAGQGIPRPGPWDLVIGVSATELIASLPIPAIGQFGVWEGGMVGVLVVMGFPRESATILAFGVHGITTAFEYFLALLALAVFFLFAKESGKKA